MIKIGTNSISFRHLDIFTFIQKVREWDLDCIDFNLSHFTSRDPAYLRDVKLAALRAGLPIGYIGVSGGFVDESLRSETFARAKDAVDVAAFVGAPLIRVFAGAPPEGVDDWEPYFAPLAACYRELCDYAATKGVYVALQNHDNRNLAAVPKDIKRIIAEVDHDNFGFLLDTGQWRGSIGAHPTGNPDPEVDIYAYIAEMIPHAVYVRTKFYRNDTGKEEWLDYERIARILEDAGYNGCLSVVYEGKSAPEEAIPKAVAELRRLF